MCRYLLPIIAEAICAMGYLLIRGTDEQATIRETTPRRSYRRNIPQLRRGVAFQEHDCFSSVIMNNVSFFHPFINSYTCKTLLQLFSQTSSITRRSFLLAKTAGLSSDTIQQRRWLSTQKIKLDDTDVTRFMERTVIFNIL